MPLDARWDALEPADWDAFARDWIVQLRGEQDSAERDLGMSVTMMGFTARPEQQWQFILAAVRHADEEQLGHIAAGPVEYLLGRHGEHYIEAVVQRAAADPKFARMLAGVWQYLMTDQVWARLQALQARHP